MFGMLMAGWLLVSGGSAPDTTLSLNRGDRVVVEGIMGSVEVLTWDRQSVAVEEESLEDRLVGVRREGGQIVVGPGDRKGRGLSLELRLRVPSWVPVEIRGRDLDVNASGTASELSVRTVEGDIVVEGVSGRVELSTVEGRVEVHGARGNITARSRGGDVTLVQVEGTVDVESGDGDLRLEDVAASSVRAQTLDGDVHFQGSLTSGGTYLFSTHDGDADLVLPPHTGARARVSTFDGEFTSDFPVTLQKYGGGGVFEFTLGDGGASLEIEVFDGEIRLRSGGR
jgi:hypothetical protein